MKITPEELEAILEAAKRIIRRNPRPLRFVVRPNVEIIS